MASKLRVLVCKNFEQEAVAIINSEGLSDIEVTTFPANCGHPPLKWRDLQEVIGKKNNDQIEIFGSVCCAKLNNPPKGLKECHIHKAAQCFDMVAGSTAVSNYLKQGAYLMTPGWLANWRQHINEWGFDRDSAQKFFKEFARKLVLLDINIDSSSSKNLQEFANFIDLPHESIPVGLDYFRGSLTKAILKRKLETDNKELAKSLSEANKQSADFAMVYDLVSGLAGITTEDKAIENIIELFTVLFAPASLIYVPLVGDQPGETRSRPVSATVDHGKIKDYLANLRADHAWSKSGDGFILRISYHGEPLGIIDVDGIAFPEYKEHYLNLALTIGRACGLAISNARTYEERKKVEEALAAERERLDVTLHSIGDAVIATDKVGIVVLLNQVAEDLTGWTSREAIGRPLGDIFSIINEKTREPAENPVAKALKLGIVVGLANHTALIAKDGREISIADSCAPIRDRDGKTLGAVLVFRDVTERKRAEAAIAESNRLSDALNKINASINSTLDFNEIMQRVIVEAANAIGTETGAIIFREGDRWLTKYSYGYEENIIGVILTDEEAPHAALVAKLKKPVAINDAYNDKGVNREIMEKYSIRSVITIPLMVRNTTVGILFLNYHTKPVSFTDVQIDFAGKLAASVSLAIENARLYEAEHRIAETLQQSLLRSVPVIPGMDIGVVYKSAHEAAMVGGDFYDIFNLSDNLVAVIVGDVSGKGIKSAGLTETIRSSVRTLAYIEPSPSFILGWTNQSLLNQAITGQFATALLLIINTETGETRFASAGHPPAVIYGDNCSYLEITPGFPLGSFAGDYAESYLKLDDNNGLILYTDGLTEARQTEELFGEKDFLKTVSSIQPKEPSKIVDELLKAASDFAGGKLQDDIAIVALRLTGCKRQEEK